jgi:hypothetical protein
MLVAADFHIQGDRGTAFGMLQMTSLLGGAFGALYATNMGGARARASVLSEEPAL